MLSAGEFAKLNNWLSLMVGRGLYWTEELFVAVLRVKTSVVRSIESRICGSMLILLLCRLPDDYQIRL